MTEADYGLSDTLSAALSRVDRLSKQSWRELLVVQTLFIQLYVTIPQFLGGRPRMYPDETLFAYTGWLWAHTRFTPYLHVWDVKPPGIHELSAVLSILAGGNPVIAALFYSIAMIAAMTLTALLIGLLVFEYTEDIFASYAAGSFLLIYPVYYRLSALGLRPKHFTAVFGLAAIYYSLQDRWLLAGVLSATAAGFWQLGIIFPLSVLGMSTQSSRTDVSKVIVGGLGAAVMILLPVVLSGWDAVIAMLIQIFGPPIVVQEPLALTDRIDQFHQFSGLGLPIIVLGVSAAVIASVEYSTKWLSGVAIWYLFQVFILDLDGYPDLILLLVVAAIGYGFAVHRLEAQSLGVILVFITATAAFVFYSGLPGYLPPANSALENGTLEWLYWMSEPPSTCHVRGSYMENQFVRELGLDPTSQECDSRVSTLKRILQEAL